MCVTLFTTMVKSRRKPVAFTDKLHVAASQQWKCAKCTCLLPSCFELDHILPVALGGDNYTSNLQALCLECHRTKSVFDLRKIHNAKRGVHAFQCSRCGLFITTHTQHECRKAEPQQTVHPGTAALLDMLESLRYKPS